MKIEDVEYTVKLSSKAGGAIYGGAIGVVVDEFAGEGSSKILNAICSNMASKFGIYVYDFLRNDPDTIVTWKFVDSIKKDNVKDNGIKDSGDRTKFESGAVRDMREGKGRCDLLPLDVVCDIFGARAKDMEKPETAKIFYFIHRFRTTGEEFYLIRAFDKFIDADPAMNSDEYTALLELAKHYEGGAAKYGDRNWEKGIPLHCFIDSALRHLLKWARGDDDEPHNRAFLWNIVGAIWTKHNRPELDDYTLIEKYYE